jgi:hypothetical protein
MLQQQKAHARIVTAAERLLLYHVVAAEEQLSVHGNLSFHVCTDKH